MNQTDQVLVAIRRVIRATDIYSKQLVKASGLTAPQLLLLQTVKNGRASSVGEIATKMSLSQATVTTIVDRLEKRNLVTRERSEQDRRKVMINPTPDALLALESAPAPLQEQFSNQFDGLKEWEKSMIVSALERVAEMMDAKDIDASPVLDIGTIDREVEVTPTKRTA